MAVKRGDVFGDEDKILPDFLLACGGLSGKDVVTSTNTLIGIWWIDLRDDYVGQVFNYYFHQQDTPFRGWSDAPWLV